MSAQMNINVFLQVTGHHEAAWRAEESDVNATFDIRHWVNLAKIAERGMLDSIFFGDTPNLPLADSRFQPTGRMDPTLILAALAGVTTNIGLIGTASTTFSHPYTLARQFATLDHISNGRSGWNIVTSLDIGSARNFGFESLPGHEERYERAAEFVEVVEALWRSWDADFLVGNKQTGEYAAEGKIHPIDHVGKYFRVKGPLNMPMPPQGRPLLVQAGASEAGLTFAANTADAVFTAMQTLESAQVFYTRLKQLVADHGRDPRRCKVLPGIVPFIGSTMREARDVEEMLGALTQLENGLALLNTFLYTSLTLGDSDTKLLDVIGLDYLESVGSKSRAQLIYEMASQDDLTVAQTARRLAASRGHQIVVGTPEDIADRMENWFTQRAADGFNLMPPILPHGLELFVDHVVPILQNRGLFRTEYPGGSLRDLILG